MVATDSAGLQTQELHVMLRVYDANDNPPYFNSPPYVVAATDCTDPGIVLGKTPPEVMERKSIKLIISYVGV